MGVCMSDGPILQEKARRACSPRTRNHKVEGGTSLGLSLLVYKSSLARDHNLIMNPCLVKCYNHFFNSKEISTPESSMIQAPCLASHQHIIDLLSSCNSALLLNSKYNKVMLLYVR